MRTINGSIRGPERIRKELEEEKKVEKRKESVKHGRCRT